MAVDPGWAVLAQLHVAVLRAGVYGQLLEQQAGTHGAAPSGPGGLVGHQHALDRAGQPIPVSEMARALAVLEAQERDRVVRFAKTAHDMGIAEAQIRLAERQGELLAAGLGWLLDSASERLALAEAQTEQLRGMLGVMRVRWSRVSYRARSRRRPDA